MQRFKKHFCNELGHYSGGHPHMTAHGKFAYGANGTLCQYARWRDEYLIMLESIAVHRFLRSRDGSYHNVLDARMYLNKARNMRPLVMLSFTLCDGRLKV